MSILFKLFQKPEEAMLSNTFHESRITLLPGNCKKGKLQRDIPDEGRHHTPQRCQIELNSTVKGPFTAIRGTCPQNTSTAQSVQINEHDSTHWMNEEQKLDDPPHRDEREREAFDKVQHPLLIKFAQEIRSTSHKHQHNKSYM